MRAARAKSTFAFGQASPADFGQYGPRHGEAFVVRRGLLHQVEQEAAAGVAVLVDAVAEAGDALAPAYPLGDHAGGLAGFVDLGQQPFGRVGRAAVQGAAEHAEAGQHHGVRVGASGGGDPGGQRGGGQFVVGEQHERGPQRGQEGGGRGLRAQTGPEPLGDRLAAGGRSAGRASTRPEMRRRPVAATEAGSSW